MAPAPPTETDINPYELLGITQESTEAEIRSAYRARSLKVHPDRNRNDPDAARKFHELTNASNLLLDPLRRLALDAQLRLASAKKARFAAYDTKRKNLVSELEEREREFKKARLEKEKEKFAKESENERVKEAGRRLREEKERELEERDRAKSTRKVEQEDVDVDAPPPLGPYDTTIRVKFPLAKYPLLNTPSSLAAHFQRFGATDEDAIVLSVKARKSGKKHKPNAPDQNTSDGPSDRMLVNALVTFTQIGAAFGAVSSSSKLREQDMEVTWAGGSEPPILQWLRDRGKLGGTTSSSSQQAPTSDDAAEPEHGTRKASHLADGSKFSTFPSTFVSRSTFSLVFSLSWRVTSYLHHPLLDITVPQYGIDIIMQPSTFPPPAPPPVATSTSSAMDYESLTLLRMREAERARLEREILEAEAKEEGS
ncbi:DnaJ domain-containing protein [Pisolithus albus]|nr:DnaJ domain-containing protein [Pisolithus albus]